MRLLLSGIALVSMFACGLAVGERLSIELRETRGSIDRLERELKSVNKTLREYGNLPPTP